MLIGAHLRDLEEGETGTIEGLVIGLRELLVRFSKQLDRSGRHGRNRQVPIASVEIGDARYCLTRHEKAERKRLSRQQMKVALLVMEGLSNKEIAKRLGVRPGTVASHLCQIYSKLNIPNRTSLASQGLLLQVSKDADLG